MCVHTYTHTGMHTYTDTTHTHTDTQNIVQHYSVLKPFFDSVLVPGFPFVFFFLFVKFVPWYMK